ncbi:MAG: Cys-tRNA(Pro) deacylase [Clostridia bacterium]|nr:Cys-tRNA(Pro) deacylase [Clostridia bacterium]MBQ4612834.1 Cys-tRNA(Pro) deacylase [Clostridia bacterium]
MSKPDKTNVMRILDQKKIPYTPHYYDPQITEGIHVAAALGENPDRVFKTLVTEAAGRRYFVFVIPVAATLDLKKAAAAVGVKALAMLKQKELLPLTGYIHGGCSPVGMKKAFPTVFHTTATDTVFVSAGRVGAQIEVDAAALAALVRATRTNLIVE